MRNNVIYACHAKSSLSHFFCRKCTVQELFRTIEDFAREAKLSSDTKFWLDVIAVNQHVDTNRTENETDVEAFEDVLKACSGGTLVVLDRSNLAMWERYNPFKRIWCLSEFNL